MGGHSFCFYILTETIMYTTNDIHCLFLSVITIRSPLINNPSTTYDLPKFDFYPLFVTEFGYIPCWRKSSMLFNDICFSSTLFIIISVNSNLSSPSPRLRQYPSFFIQLLPFLEVVNWSHPQSLYKLNNIALYLGCYSCKSESLVHFGPKRGFLGNYHCLKLSSSCR